MTQLIAKSSINQHSLTQIKLKCLKTKDETQIREIILTHMWRETNVIVFIHVLSCDSVSEI